MVDLLFYLTKCAIYHRELPDYKEIVSSDSFDWDSFMKLAKDNSLIPIIYSVITDLDKDSKFLNDDQKNWITKSAKGTLLPELNKYFLINQIAKKAKEKDIIFIFFKGIVLADLYPQYVERVSSDTDILVDDKDLEGAQGILKELGYYFDPEESKDNVKVYLHSNPRHMVELHTRLWEDYKGPVINRLESLELAKNPISINACNIDIWTLSHENHLIYQLFHIIKHFSLEGIGARCLVDITLFVNRYGGEIDFKHFWEQISILGYTKFVETFFSICIDSLDMDSGIMDGHQIASSNITELLKNDLIKGGSVMDEEARWQIMGAMEAYFTGESRVPHSKFKRQLFMMFPPIEALPKVYTYAKKYPILLPTAWLHRDIKFLIKRLFHRRYFFGVREKVDVGENRLNLIEELGLNEDIK